MKSKSNQEGFNSTNNTKRTVQYKSLRRDLQRKIDDQPKKAPLKLKTDGSSLSSKRGKVESVLTTMNKLAKGKLSLGAKHLHVGRAEKLFRRVFSIRDGERLIKTCKCCLFTTAGPISGRLFISTYRLTFCSDKPVRKSISSSTGEALSFHYKVVIPLQKIHRANQSESVKSACQKYLQLVTTDDFEFWFLGFVNYKRTCKCVQQALS